MAKAPVKDPKQEDLIANIEQEAPFEEPALQAIEGEEPEPQEEDATVALRQQIENLKKSEDLLKNRAERYRQEAQEAQRVANERASEVVRVRKDSVQAQADAINTALASAQGEAESAKAAIKMAIQNGDVDQQADAYERLAVAQANIANLQTGKLEVEAKLKVPQQEERPQSNGIPPRVQRWLQRHPEYMSDPKKNDKLRAFHWDVLDEGHDFDSEEYIESMETKLGLRKTQPVEEEEPEIVTEQSQRRAAPVRQPPVSAPPSRETQANSGTQRSGQIRLSPAQLEAAKIAGVTPKVYAEHLQKLNEAKAT